MYSSGYSHPLYAASLDEFGTPFFLKASGGWLLQRPIDGGIFTDAMGCYPLFCCEDWSLLEDDLDEIGSKLVSVVLVTDPFGKYNKALLQHCFDFAVPYKDHFVVDLEQPFKRFASRSHLRFGRLAQRQMQIEICANPLSFHDEWCRLYDELIVRKGIYGIRAFSRNTFARQLAVPGIVMFRASVRGRTIALDLWYVQGEVAQGHLVAMSSLGYELHAGYALKLTILEYFKDRLKWVNLGGIPSSGKDLEGLAAFKRGWCSGIRTAWLCGRVLNKRVYADLVRSRENSADSSYFPAYRSGELI